MSLNQVAQVIATKVEIVTVTTIVNLKEIDKCNS
jgi:hypothetical protein